MDSLPGEDPTLPLELSGSVNLSRLPDVSGDDVRIHVGVLPDVAEDTVSPTRARTMKDFENQIMELRKENFNLKLRIYFLEERMQQKFDGRSEEVYRINIELKVELESLKRELREREQLLIKASKAVESLAQGGDGEVQRLKEEARKRAQREESLTSRINLLEEDLKTAHEEMEKALMVTERERVLRLAAEQQLSTIPKMQPKELEMMVALEEKDRCIQELSLSLQNKDALIQHLEQAKSQRSHSPASPEASESQSSPGGSLSEEKIQNCIAALEEKEGELEALRTELRNEKNSLEKRIQSLQEDLRQREGELSLEKRNALKRDKTIQGLTIALRRKEKENDELNSEVQNISTALAKAREATHTAQMQTFKGAEDCQSLLMEKEGLLVELRSQNLNKDMENRKLLRKVKRIDQELNDLRLERERLMNELDEAQLQKSRSDKTINDLRNQLEKAHVEVAEKEKALECHYAALLSESGQKLQSQESVIACLTDGAAEKDRLLQELTGTVREKEAELQQWVAKFHGLLKAKEGLQRQNDDLVKENLAAQARKPVLEMIEELENTKASEYAEVMEALRKERDTFARLVESLKGADGASRLQEELNMVVLLRKQLEEDILANWNLRKVLEDPLKGNRKEEETISSWGDQTSYMSICLRELDHWTLQIDQLSLEELRKKVLELLSAVKELHASNEEMRQKQLEFSKLDLLAQERPAILDQSEFLEEAEESRTLTGSFQDETITLSGPLSDSTGKGIPSDSLSAQCASLNQPGFEPAINPVFGGSTTGQSYDAQEGSSVAPLSDGTGVAVLGSSTEEQMNIANKPLDHLNTAVRDSSSDDLKHKSEEDLKGLIIQLRDQLRHLVQGNESITQPGGLESALAEQEAALDPDPALPANVDAELSRVAVKDTATQTVLVQGSALKLKHEGKIPTSEDKGGRSRLNQEWERHQQRACVKNEPREAPPHTSRINKSDSGYPFKKSRLPVLLKPSRSLGSLPGAGRADMHLQQRIFTLDEDLKGKPAQPQVPTDELQQNGSEYETSEHDAKLAGVESLIKMDDSEVDLTLVSDETKDETSKEQITSQETTSSKQEPSLTALKGPNQELCLLENQDGDSVTTYSGSKSLLSLKLSVTSVDVFDDGETVDDVEGLRRRVKELKSELAKYRLLASHAQATKPLPPSDKELPADSAFFPMLDARQLESQAFAEDRQREEYPVQVEDPMPCAPEKPDGATVEKLKEMLLENEAELEKEQIANMHLLDEVYRLQSKLTGASPSGSDSLLPSPADKHSCQRQKFRESHSVCARYRHHLTGVVRAFEELLRDSEVDYFVAEGFREQLSQSVQLFEKLAKQCLYGEPPGAETTPLRSLTPSLADFEEMEKLSNMEPAGPKKEDMAEDEREQPAIMPAQFPPELLMEHLQEIRMLRHQLEESIKTNDRLRKRLENQAADPAKDPGAADICIRDSEQRLPLTPEIHFLRKQNQLLNDMLAKGSQDKQKENEKLRESLSKRQLAAESLRKDHERIKEQNEKLQSQVERQEEENERLTLEVYNVRNELNRLQVELDTKQHQVVENDKLLHSLRLELKVFEKLDKAIRSQKERSRDGSEECWKDQTRPLDLHELLTEIQSLRAQLERSIEANQALHGKLEEQLLRGKREGTGSTLSIGYLFKQESQHYAALNEFRFPSADRSVLELQQKYGCWVLPPRQAEPALDEADGSSQRSSSTSKFPDPPAVPGHCVWADKNGRHVLGSVEDYNALRKQIAEGRRLLSDVERRLKELQSEELEAKFPHQVSLSRLSSTTGMIRHNLEEAVRLLKLLWRVSLPMKVVHSAAYSLQDEGLKGELHKLRRKLAEQEKKLHSTAKRLHSTTQLKENMERLIIDQLALTHDVLRKARGNLEVQPAENKKSTYSLSKTRVL
ncbi:CDK5 regulatory subunit-associated protein 2 isoform X2 [Tiliqua scincoides]|uniref:CDK5 regulatory subunit-associated protein 2 isoform X2 n=1 Tax=Tiliqua scincoides TaxID=71010 RepID=UPI0034630B11